MTPLRTGEPARIRDAFDPERVRSLAVGLSYPRLTGTPGERRAGREVARRLTALGYETRREAFTAPHAAREAGVRVVYALCALCLFAGLAVRIEHTSWAAGLWLVAVFLVNAPWRVMRGVRSERPGGLRSHNVIAEAPAVDDAPARVVFMAHYDSKSQVVPTGVRVGLVVAASVSGLLLLAAAGAAELGWAAALRGPLPWTPVILATVVLILLSANVTGNRSPGALDNATGVGTLLELARTWRPEPDAPVEALFVATGAEELGLDGARAFLARHEDALRDKPTLIVNLDSVGARGRLFLAGEPAALELAEHTAAGLDLATSRLRAVGAAMDHEPFAAAGLPAVSILGDVVAASLLMHSCRDVPARIDAVALERAGRLAGAVARAWGRSHATGFRVAEAAVRA